MINIWHTLAENALNGAFNKQSKLAVSERCSQIKGPSEITLHFTRCKNLNEWFYDEMTPEEQCLFLLFCGESYED